MQAATLPTKYGYALVIDHNTVREGGFSVRAPIPIPQPVRIQVAERIKTDAAEYLWEISRWERTGLVALVWAALSILAIYVSSIWDYGWRMIALYGWVRIWFMGDGLWVLSQLIAKWRDIQIARALRETCGDLAPLWALDRDMPTLAAIPDYAKEDEEEILREMADRFPSLAPYYNQMLKVCPPRLHDEVPLTLFGRLRNMLCGKPVRLPPLVYYIGRLDAGHTNAATG